ncbi:unnamed protein product [Mytilus coruscus]|uniref:Reverse transcriptase domain-containing protein n=1 Tax=Mytilus coruscus TaxID=42192 RepID=A0A6J8BYL1_MYTCO|nr:unnamed protein product [Mytilus coruscus]
MVVKSFSKLDLSQAYQQLLLCENSRNLVTINTHLGLYRYTRLPFGAASSPAIFQEFMDKVLEGLDGVGCILDDLIITEKSDEEHFENLELVLKRLSEYGLRLKKSKCSLMKSEVTRFHQYLYGRKFTLITDNKPLSLLLGPKTGIPMLAASRIQRWAIQLSGYQYDVKCKSSSENANADGLSRLPLKETLCESPFNIFWEEVEIRNVQALNELPVSANNIKRETEILPLIVVKEGPSLFDSQFLPKRDGPSFTTINGNISGEASRQLQFTRRQSLL